MNTKKASLQILQAAKSFDLDGGTLVLDKVSKAVTIAVSSDSNVNKNEVDIGKSIKSQIANLLEFKARYNYINFSACVSY